MRLKTCKVCKTKFTPTRPLEPCCSFDCRVAYGLQVIAKNTEKKRRIDAKARREGLEKIKPRSRWIAETQAIFNKWRRLVDKEKPCVSCGDDNPPMTRGGQWDCGHYLSVGSHPELRFDPLNTAKQCKKCNGGAGRFAKKNMTVSKQFRQELIERIGLEKVEWLEGPHEAKKYTIDDLKAIKKEYAMKVKELGAMQWTINDD